MLSSSSFLTIASRTANHETDRFNPASSSTHTLLGRLCAAVARSCRHPLPSSAVQVCVIWPSFQCLVPRSYASPRHPTRSRTSTAETQVPTPLQGRISPYVAKTWKFEADPSTLRSAHIVRCAHPQVPSVTTGYRPLGAAGAARASTYTFRTPNPTSTSAPAAALCATHLAAAKSRSAALSEGSAAAGREYDSRRARTPVSACAAGVKAAA